MVTKKKTVDRSKTYKQKPVPGTNRLIDLVTPALPPGWRISERTGKPYFENRENRSDTAAEIAAFVPKPKKKTTAKKVTAKRAPDPIKPTGIKFHGEPIPKKDRSPALFPPAFVYNYKKIRCIWDGKGNLTFEVTDLLKDTYYRDVDYKDLPGAISKDQLKDYCRQQINYNVDWIVSASTRGPSTKKAPAAKKPAPMAVIYGPYLTGSTGYALKKGTGKWEGYWCIRQGSRKNNKGPFVWSSSEAVTMGHISMDRGETAALQYLADVAKRKGWKQMYPKKPAALKKPTAEPKTASPKKRAAPKKAKPRQKGQATLF